MKATIYDVAREAGVSIAAVSQVINGKGKISEERRNEIFAVMERLDYKPSVIAAALTGKKTYTFGLLIPDISNPFFAEIARAVEDRGHQLGYSIFICSTDNNDERVERYLSVLQQKSVDGIIVGTGMDHRDMLQPVLRKSMPVVLVARELPGLNVDTVVIDDYAGGYLAGGHLAGLGHKRIAVLAESAKLVSSRERIRGFREACEEAGLEWDESLVRTNGADLVKDGRRNAADWLASEDRPTAIFCCNDLLAIGALQAAKERGLRIPADLSIVGFDNTILATATDPPLTTVAQPTGRMGELAVDLLLEQEGSRRESPRRAVLAPELVLRESTAALRE